MAVFLNCSVLFELKTLPFKEKVKMKLAVTENGGSMSFVANKQCSLVVTSGVSSLSPGRLRNIVKYQIPVVGLDYVRRCLEANCRLPVEDFQLDISSSANAHPVVHKDKWTKDNWTKDTSKTLQNLLVPLEPVRVSLRDESPKHRESVHKDEDCRDNTEMDHGLSDFPENFEVAKYAIFQKQNSNSWCLLELQSAKTENARRYSVVKNWKENIQSKKAAMRDQVCVSTSEEALKEFEDLIETMKERGLEEQKEAPPTVTEMGSAPLQQLLLEERLTSAVLSPAVGVFVELLWREALGCVDHILRSPVSKISLNDVTRAEGLLHQVQRKLQENKMEEMLSLWSEYVTLLPPRVPVSPNTASISQQFNLCQVIRDILNATEMTLGSAAPSSVGKYRALRCGIQAVSPESSEFEEVINLLPNSNVKVHQVLRVDRASELQNFRRELGNIKALLHSSSPHNFVGILSRGLLLPHVAVDQHGVQRTDAGDLGGGIYFSDDIKTSVKYSQCSSSDGSRLMLVCDVALGRCLDLFQKDPTLTQAPQGHDSVHGVQGRPGLQSQFKDDEYVVYSADQVRLKYVVKFSLEGEETKALTPDILQPEQPQLPSPDYGVGAIEEDLSDIENPLENVTAGLLDRSGRQIPLQAVHVKCKLMDLLSQVIIFQKYTNGSSMPIEAKYVFPLDDLATVTGFEAFINGKHVVGQVKEKETARREYKQAVEKGHGAYLMDQDAPDVFTISVGNLPPAATVLIKVTFVSELLIRDGSVVFSLPGSVAPWQQSAALNQTTQVTVEKVCVTDEEANSREFNLDMSVEMPHEITEVKCITHKVKVKKTACKAVLSVLPGEVMGPDGFQVQVSVSEVHVPRMWVENHPSKESQACMLVFYPKIESASSSSSDEVVLLLDASESMRESLNTSRTLALEILKTLPQNVKVNVIFFATDHTEAFLSARPIGIARREAKNFIKHSSSVGGSTELWRPLRVLSLLPPSSGTRNLLLLSDGHIQNPELTLQLLRQTDSHSRLFTCGLSTTANRHMLRALAHAGGGAYEFFDHKSKHTWSEKVASQVKRMLAPGARSVSVKWQQFNSTAPPIQAPKQIHSLFNDCHTLVFGFVSHCTQATLFGKLSEEEINTMVSTSELQKTRGTFLHKLTARAIIRDFEDGSLDSNAVLHEEKKAELKSLIITLSKEFSILSQFTSFVAIEERDSEEERGSTDVPKLISEEDVDFLPYMRWEEEEKELTVGANVSFAADCEEHFDFEEDEWIVDNESLRELHEDVYECMDMSLENEENVEATEECQSLADPDSPSSESEEDSEAVSLNPDTDYIWKIDTICCRSNGLILQSPPPPPSPPAPPTAQLQREASLRSRKKTAPKLDSQQLDSPQSESPQSDVLLFESSKVKMGGGALREGARLSPMARLQRASFQRDAAPDFVLPQSPENEFQKSMAVLFRPVAVDKSSIYLSRLEKDFSPSPPPPLHALCFGAERSSEPCFGLKRQTSEGVSMEAGPGQSAPQSDSPQPDAIFSFGSHSHSYSVADPPQLIQKRSKFIPRAFRRSLSQVKRDDSPPSPPPPPAPPSAQRQADPITIVAPPLPAPPSAQIQADPITIVAPPPPAPPSAQRQADPITIGAPPPPAPPSAQRQADPITIGAPPPPAPPSAQRQADPITIGAPPPPAPPSAQIQADPITIGAPPPPWPQQQAPAFPQRDSVFQGASLQTEICGIRPPLGLPWPQRQLCPLQPITHEAPHPSITAQTLPGAVQGSRSIPYINPFMISSLPPLGDLSGSFYGFGSSGIENGSISSKSMENLEQSIPLRCMAPSIMFSKQVRHFTLSPNWSSIFLLQRPEGYWELTPELGTLLNCNISRFADDFLKRKGIASLGLKAHADILKLLATLLVLQLMRLQNTKEGTMLRTLFHLEDGADRPEYWAAVSRAVQWACWADGQYPCVCSRLEFGLSWDSSTKQLLGAESIQPWSPLTGLDLNPRPYRGPMMRC